MMPPQREQDNNKGTMGDGCSEPSASLQFTPPPSARRSQDETNSLSEGESDIGWMRELDADILEKGIVETCSTGETPVLKPLSCTSPVNGSEPLDLLSSIENDTDAAKETSSITLAEPRHLATDTRNEPEFPLSQNGQENDNDDRDQMPEEYSVSLHPFLEPKTLEMAGNHSLSGRSLNGVDVPRSKFFVRRCLSGEERMYQVTDETSENADSGSGISGASPVSVVATNHDVDDQEDPSAENQMLDENEFNSIIIRTKSRERLISENMLFADSVGEMPPAENEVQQIIEESGSDSDDDDDDDDAKEIHVENEIYPAAASPQKPSRAIMFQNLSGPVDTNLDTRITENDNAGGSRAVRFSPRWQFKPAKGKSTQHAYLHSLPENVEKQDYHYKGICANPPEITKRGISRGNYALLHRKAWLEVSDKYHRYGKNLRLYYRKWESLGHPTNTFFDWLDSKGEAAGQPLPNLDECPRSQLDSDTVLYINNEEMQKQYELSIASDEAGRALFIDPLSGDHVVTGQDGWIFVLRDHKLYASEKITSINGHCKQRFHHSSFFSGKAVAAAGIIITDDEGHMTRFYPHSGHYRPGEAHVQRMLFHLHHCGVDLRTFEVDTQQILHVNRKENTVPRDTKEGEVEEKKKKVQALHLQSAIYVAWFLAHKARFIGEGIFSMIHKIRKADVASVTEALCVVDEGGYWVKLRRELAGLGSKFFW